MTSIVPDDACCQKLPDPVHVVRAIGPDASEYMAYVEQILASGYFTNNSRNTVELENKLQASLGVPHLALCANGTLALQLAIRAAGLNGKKVITTPFSYVATVSALLWEGCEPVFADIDPETLSIDPAELARVYTPDVAGIMPVFIYGYPGALHEIEAFGRLHGVKVVYDAAQAYGCMYQGQSLASYGDFAALSFHATKPFHTIEGGAVVSHSEAEDADLRLKRAGGFKGETHYTLGINAKMGEMHAAMGLCLLPKVAGHTARRAQLSALYDDLLPVSGLRRIVPPSTDFQGNYAYYPVVFETEEQLLRVMSGLQESNIFPRRYFYPSLNTLPYLNQKCSCPVAEDIARRVLCLPLYSELEAKTVKMIVQVVVKYL